MNNKQLRAFVAVYETGSMTKASEQIFVSVPALKKQLDTLESEVGIRLLNRTPRGIQPTAAGDHFYHYACDSIAALENELKYLQEIALQQENLIRVGFNTRHIRDPFYFHAATYFKEQYPNVKIDLMELASYSPDACDVFVGVCDDDEHDLKSCLLCNMSVHCLLPLTHPLAGRQEINLEELLAYPLILPPREITQLIQPDIMSQIALAPSVQHISFSDHSMSYIIQASLTNNITIIAGYEDNIIAPVVQIPIHGYKIPYCVHVQRSNCKPILKNYVEILQKFYQKEVARY